MSPPSPAAPHAKRPLHRRWALWLGVVLLVLVLIAIVVAVTGNKKSASPTTNNAATTTLPHHLTTPGSTPTSTTPRTKTAPPTTRSTTTRPTTPPSTASPPATTLRVGSRSCTASMSNPKPGDSAQDTVIVSSNVPEAPVKITKKYKTTTSIDTAYTSRNGAASLTFGVGSPTPHFTVQVNVNVDHGAATCSTSFTPQ
jgi:hypothetical protein